MAEKKIYNNLGKKIGSIKEMGNGKIVYDELGRKRGEIKPDSSDKEIINDNLGRKIGIYDIKRDETKDKRGIKIGKGNLTLNLLGFVDVKEIR